MLKKTALREDQDPGYEVGPYVQMKMFVGPNNTLDSVHRCQKIFSKQILMALLASIV